MGWKSWPCGSFLPQTFGILMSMEPVLAALSGFVFLGERLNAVQWIALVSIIVASVGATLTIRHRR
ncbi:MAG: EamA family transporter [Bilophila sp.]